MSLSDLIPPEHTVDDDDDDGEFRVAPTPAPTYELARLVLEASLSAETRKLLRSDCGVVIIHAPDPRYADAFKNVLQIGYRNVVSHVATERKKSTGSYRTESTEPLSSLERRRTVVFITQDPGGLLAPEVRAAADQVVVVKRPSLRIVRAVIRRVTGGTARGLQPADIAGLGLIDLAAGIRIGSRPRDCVLRLRNAALVRRLSHDISTAPSIEELPLTRIVETWATTTVKLMRDIGTGAAEPRELRYATLEGPPGTGKTLLAAALAKSADWSFVGSSIGEWFVSKGDLGDVARAANAFFEAIATADGGVVAFIDEIDSLPSRAGLDADRASWWTPVVTFVLTQIDQLRRSGRPILLLGATNHYDRLDPALIRAGRLETRVSVMPPDRKERKEIFRHYLSGLDDAALETLARLSPKATPAQIESWAIAARASAKAEDRAVELQDLLELLVPQSGSSKRLKAVCIHESGHAVTALEVGLPIVEISALEGDGLGGWVSTNFEDRLWTKSDVEAVGTMLLAGRAADTLLGSGPNAGARGDLAAANRLLFDAMVEYGLYGSLLTQSTLDVGSFGPEGETLARSIALELDRMLARAMAIVERRRDDVLRLAAALEAERVISGERARELLGGSETAPSPSHDDIGAGEARAAPSKGG